MFLLDTLTFQQLNTIFSDPWVFRLVVWSLSKQSTLVLMRITLLNKTIIPKKTIQEWLYPPIEFSQVLTELEQYALIDVEQSSETTISFNPIILIHLKTFILGKDISLYSKLYSPSTTAKKHITPVEIHDFARNSYQYCLMHLIPADLSQLSSSTVKKTQMSFLPGTQQPPSPELTQLFKHLGFLDDSGFHHEGFRFLLQPRSSQLSLLVSSMLQNVLSLDTVTSPTPSSSVESIKPPAPTRIRKSRPLASVSNVPPTEILSILCRLPFIPIGQPFDPLFFFENKTISQEFSKILVFLSFFGILHKIDPTSYITTPLVYDLFDNLVPNLSLYQKKIDIDDIDTHGKIIVETNFRIYVYNPTPIQICLMSLFVRWDHRLPTAMIGKITRFKFIHGLKQGISVSDVTEYLKNNLHSSCSEIPQVVLEEFLIWSLSLEKISWNDFSMIVQTQNTNLESGLLRQRGFNCKIAFSTNLENGSIEHLIQCSNGTDFDLLTDYLVESFNATILS